MKVNIVMFRQDDPDKCTAAKLVKFGLARNIRKTPDNSIILDPFAASFLLYQDAAKVNSVTAIDCSWNLADDVFTRRFTGIKRRLPPLLAGNPVNYAKLNKLTTVEAISAALYVLGQKDYSQRLLDKFKWGHTFYELNQSLLEDYSKASSPQEIETVASDHGLSA